MKQLNLLETMKSQKENFYKIGFLNSDYNSANKCTHNNIIFINVKGQRGPGL